MLGNRNVANTIEDRQQLVAEINAAIQALPEDQDKGKLRGLLVRLSEVCTDARRFEAELQKLAALSETVARKQPARRLHELVRSRTTGQ